jgi:hypothetical protein
MALAVALNPEAVKSFLASIASALAATKTWLELRDRRAAKNQATVTESLVLSDPKTAERVQALLAIVPAEVLERLINRYKKCFKKFEKMLDEEDVSFPGEVDKAARTALPNCVCQALATIKKVAGTLGDPILEDAWKLYKCDIRVREDAD